MKVFNKRFLKQNAIYWGTPVNDGYGAYTFNDPIEIKCRWEYKQELFISTNGVEQHSVAKVFVEQELEVEGYLMLGTLDDLDSVTNDPYDLPTGFTAYQIKGYSNISSISNKNTLKKVWLSKGLNN